MVSQNQTHYIAKMGMHSLIGCGFNPANQLKADSASADNLAGPQKCHNDIAQRLLS